MPEKKATSEQATQGASSSPGDTVPADVLPRWPKEVRSRFYAGLEALGTALLADGTDPSRWQTIRTELLAVVRPALDTKLEPSAGQPAVGATRFGGDPDLAPGSEWPRRAGEPLVFVGQINLGDLAESHAALQLPRAGLVSFFYAYDPENEVFRRFEDDPWVCLLTASPEATERLTPPADLPLRFDRPHRAVFTETADVPFDREQTETLSPALFSIESYDFWDPYTHELRERLHSSDARNQLFGYPRHCTLAYDPTPGPDWVSFLNLWSEPSLGWCWGDGDRLMVFARQRDLAEHRFSGMKTDEG